MSKHLAQRVRRLEQRRGQPAQHMTVLIVPSSQIEAASARRHGTSAICRHSSTGAHRREAMACGTLSRAGYF